MPSTLCSQCGKSAVLVLDSHPLCVEHYSLLMQAQQASLQATERQINYLAEMMEFTAGVPIGSTPRIRQPAAVQSQATFNNINIQNSTVGTINTGHIQTLDQVVTSQIEQGNTDVAEAIKNLTEAIANSEEADNRDELIDLLAFVGLQSTKPEEGRSKSLLKSALSTVSEAISVASAGTTLATSGPAALTVLKGWFGL